MSRSQVLVILWLCALFPILILAGSVVAIAGTNEHFNMFKALLVSVSFPLLLIMLACWLQASQAEEVKQRLGYG